MQNHEKTYEVEGVIQDIKYPFSLFKKSKPIIYLRLKNGIIMEMETSRELIEKLPISIGVGMYTEAQYKNKPNGKGYEIVQLF